MDIFTLHSNPHPFESSVENPKSVSYCSTMAPSLANLATTQGGRNSRRRGTRCIAGLGGGATTSGFLKCGSPMRRQRYGLGRTQVLRWQRRHMTCSLWRLEEPLRVSTSRTRPGVVACRLRWMPGR
jgi:hypothetical protein